MNPDAEQHQAWIALVKETARELQAFLAWDWMLMLLRGELIQAPYAPEVVKKPVYLLQRMQQNTGGKQKETRNVLEEAQGLKRNIHREGWAGWPNDACIRN